MKRENISVCMATYNGANYLEEQIESIINQLIDGDELIIVDDGSKDLTVKIALNYDDSRIKIIVNDQNIGVNKNFEKAIRMANHNYIFLADQDDIWVDGRLDLMYNALKDGNYNLVSGNSLFIDSNGQLSQYIDQRLEFINSNKIVKNILEIFRGAIPYFGCAMAFRKELSKIILPFPSYIESHDLWIVKASLLMRKNLHLEDNVLYRRIHQSNASVIKRPLLPKIWSRIVFLKSIIELSKRIKQNN